MPESAKATAVKTEAKVEKAVEKKQEPEVRPHPSNIHAQLLYQQRTVGNRAVQRFIKSRLLQEKHTVSRPDDIHDEEKPLQMVQRQITKEENQETSLQPQTPASKIPRITTQPGSGMDSVSHDVNIHTNTNSNVPNIQAAWYNFDIPFTDYQFDPSIQGVKNAANIVKDTAVAGLEWIVDEIKGLVSSGINWLSEKWTSIQEFASSAFEAVKNSFTNIIGFVKNPLSFIADAIMGFDAQSLAKAWAKFSGIVSTVSNGFKLLTENLFQQVNKVWGRISGFATSLLNKVAGLTQNFLFKKLPDALQRIAFTVIDQLKSLWKSISDRWNKIFNKIKIWIESALDTVFKFVHRIVSFGINVVVDGIIQFGKIVLFLKDLFSNPQKYIDILAQKSAQAFDGVETRFAGIVSQYFGNDKATAPAAITGKIQRQPASATVPETKRSASWSEIGSGISEMMGKKWNEFKSNPLSVVIGLLRDMVFPIIGNIEDIIKLFKDIKKIVTGPLSAGSLEELWTSFLQILDIPILIYHTVVSILMRSLMVPLIVASFVRHPLVTAIASAVGYGLLGAFVQSELLNIGQKILLLKTGSTNSEQKKEAYNRVADSLIAFIMAAVITVIMLILHFIANIMKGIFNFIKGKVFPVEKAPVQPPKQLGPGPEPPKQLGPGPEPPKQLGPGPEPPKQLGPGPEPPKQLGPGPEPPKTEPPKTEPPKEEPPRTEPPKEDPPTPKRDLKDLTIEELTKEGEKKPRPKETKEQAEARVKDAKAEAQQRGYCFVKGTFIQTPEGPRRIETLVAGQMVLAMGEDDSVQRYTIIECIQSSTLTLYHLEIDETLNLSTTRNHPFFIHGRGWTKAKDLVVGDKLLSLEREIVLVTNVFRERLLEPVTTFNFHVEEVHSYFAGNDPAVLVHNGTKVGDPVLTKPLIWGLGAGGPRQRMPSKPKDPTSADPKLRDPFPGDTDGASGWRTNSTDETGRLLGARNTEGGTSNHGAITEAQLKSKGLVAVETEGTGALAEAGFKHVSIRPEGNPDPKVELTEAEMADVKAKLEELKPVAQNKPSDFLC